MADVARRTRARGEAGSELIELAIVLPILLLVFAAIIDFGFLFQRFETLTNAAREGARVGALPGYSAADVQARVNAYLAASGMPGAPSAFVQTVQQTLPSGHVVGMVEVVAFYHTRLLYLGPIASLVGGGPRGSITLRARSLMRTEAPASGS